MMRGEVDDLAAATRRLAEVPGVDGERIFAFGHSIGGGLSDLLALLPDVPVRGRDAFLTLAKTCRKLAVSFWDYLGSRLAVPGAPSMPPLPDLVRCRGRPA